MIFQRRLHSANLRLFSRTTSKSIITECSANSKNNFSLSLLAMHRMIPPLVTIQRINPFIKEIEVPVYNFRDLKPTSSRIKITSSLLKNPIRGDIAHKMIVGYLAGLRQGTACTKNRGEVSGGGRKLYAQKGTGRARAGSSRAPHRRGGGIAFGPKPRDYSADFNRKEVMFACRSVFANKFKMGHLKIIDDSTVPHDIVKTKQMAELAPFKLEGGSLFLKPNINESFVKASRMLKQFEHNSKWGTPEFVYLALKRKNLLISRSFLESRLLLRSP